MTPRRIRAARRTRTTRTVVIEHPQRIDMQTADILREHAARAFPGRRIVILDSGMTARLEG